MVHLGERETMFEVEGWTDSTGMDDRVHGPFDTEAEAIIHALREVDYQW